MGADLPKASAGAKAPKFLAAAMKDHIQIIKGWLDEDGKTHEKIYDVVWGNAGRRKRGANCKVPQSATRLRSGIDDGLEGSRLQCLAKRLLLCTCPRDSHTALDRLRLCAFRREDVSRSPVCRVAELCIGQDMGTMNTVTAFTEMEAGNVN